MKWEDLGLRCLDSGSARMPSVDAANRPFITDRFVPLNWTAAKGPAHGLATADVGKVAALIGSHKITARCCLEAVHAYETIGSAERQRQLFIESGRGASFRSLLWRMAMVCGNTAWSQHVISRLAVGADKCFDAAVKQELKMLFVPFPRCKLTKGMHSLLRIRASQLANLLSVDVQKLWRLHCGAVPLTCLAAVMRYDSIPADGFKPGDVNENGILNKGMVDVIMRMDADANLLANWNKWYYGQGVFGGDVPKMLIAYGKHGHLSVNQTTAAALMLLTPEFRIEPTKIAMERAGKMLFKFFQKKGRRTLNRTAPLLPALAERKILGMLGIANHCLVNVFLEHMLCAVSPQFRKKALTEPAFLAFLLCNTVHTKCLRLPNDVVRRIHTFL